MYDDEIEVGFAISVIESEIQYAKSQLQPHDTGHIHTSIAWMEKRVRDLKETLSARSSAG